MAAPTIDSEHPGLQVIAEVASILAAGLGSSDALTASVSALRRGLSLRRCRLWLRAADGVGFRPLGAPGDEAELGGTDTPVVDWIAKGPTQEAIADGLLLRLPLVHDDESLGALEVIIPRDGHQAVAHDTVVVVAKILAPVIAATELSQDLASEVAIRTRE